MKFSVIIPTYNRVDLLAKALVSVNSQTYTNYEIIIVNDNPIDSKSIDELSANYDKIKVIHHSQSRGGNAARNTGLHQSTGDLIAFLDDDDIWLPEKLSDHYNEHLKNDRAGLVYSDCLYVYNTPAIPDKKYSAAVPDNVLAAMAKSEFCPATSSIVSIRRACINECGVFDEKLPSFQDWDYWFRIAHKFPFAHIPKILVHFTQHLGERTSQNESKRRNGLAQIISKWKGEIDAKQFEKNSIISIYNKNSRNALLAGNKFVAFKKSLKLLNPGTLSSRSIKSFVKLLIDILFK